MPQVSFIGELKDVVVGDSTIESACVSYAIIPGNSNWYLRFGNSFGETNTCAVDSVKSNVILNHPIDNTFDTSTVEGWPLLVVEVI